MSYRDTRETRDSGKTEEGEGRVHEAGARTEGETHQSQTGVKGLLQDRVCWVEDQLGQQDLVTAFVDLES